MNPSIEVFPTSEAVHDAAAERFVTLANAAVTARGRFVVALAGGATPRPMYERLASPALAARVPWPAVHVFWSDERFVRPGHPDSNQRMARQALLDRVPIPRDNVHPVDTDVTPEASAADYTASLSAALGAGGLDLVLLGLGADGHTASLFPGNAAAQVARRGAVAAYVPALDAWRISLSLGELSTARQLVFLVTAPDKARALADVRRGREDLPAARVRPACGQVDWLLDRATADALVDVETALARAEAAPPTGADELKRRVGLAAAELVASGMRLGLGTGSTANQVVAAVGARLRSGALADVVAVATSAATADLARAQGVPLVEAGTVPRLDLTIDGADEISPALDLIKGLGGALVREKVVAAGSDRFVIVADRSKLVPRLGARAPLPVAVVPFAWRGHLSAIADIGAAARLRAAGDGTPFVSDDGLYMLDCRFPGGIDDPARVARSLAGRPGVVDTGLFLGMAEAALVADERGVVVYHRSARPTAGRLAADVPGR